MKKIEKLQANCLTMKSEFNQIYKKESQAVDSSELYFHQAAQRKIKEEVYKQAVNNLKSSFKLGGLDVIMKSINTIKENISTITNSKTVPSQLENSIRVICVAADILKLASFSTFRSIIKDLYGNQVLTQLSNPEAVTPDIRMFFTDQTFSANEITDAINRIAKKVFRGDLSKIEFITGPQNQPTNKPTNQKRYNQAPPQSQLPRKPSYQLQPPPSQPSNQYQPPPSQPSNQYQPPPSQPSNKYQPPPSQPSNKYQPPPSQPSNQYQPPPSQPSNKYQPPPSQPSNQYQPSNPPAFTPPNNTPQPPPQQQPQIPQISYPDPGNFKIPSYPTVKEPVFNQSKNHQNTQNQQNVQNQPNLQNNQNNSAGVLRNQVQNIVNIGNATESYHTRNHFEQHPEIYHLADVPVFPREIWPQLSKIVTSSVA